MRRGSVCAAAQNGNMSLVPELSRRAALRLGASAVAGAAGIWTFGGLVDPTQVPADPSPFDPAAPAGPPAPPVAAPPAPPAPMPTKVSGSFVSADEQAALAQLRCEKQMVIVPGATHLFEEPGALDEVARLARAWFERHLGSAQQTSAA